jgi:hypothetical protein
MRTVIWQKLVFRDMLQGLALQCCILLVLPWVLILINIVSVEPQLALHVNKTVTLVSLNGNAVASTSSASSRSMLYIVERDALLF